ncbi:MAG: anti-sigma factor family protein [Paracoccaceae bacterium]
MNSTPIIDREKLAAFADGELSPEEAAAVVIYLADHPEEKAWLDSVMMSNVTLSRAFSGPVSEPVPERFSQLIQADGEAAPNVVPLRSATSAANRPLVFAAAGLGLAAGIAAMALVPSSTNHLDVGPVPFRSSLYKVLDTSPSGEAQSFKKGEELTILASMPTPTGHCREFELVGLPNNSIRLGLACRTGEGWTLDVLLIEVAESRGEVPSAYATAAGGDVGAIDIWLDRRGAGMALTPEEEAELITNGWEG